MKYPYTRISKRDLPMIYNTLKSLGYYFAESLITFLDRYFYTKSFYVVINDMGVFGAVCFYAEHNQLDPGIPRTFIADEIKFLKECAKLKGETEF